MVDLGPASQIDEAVEGYRSWIAASGDETLDSEEEWQAPMEDRTGQAVRRLIWEPLEPHLNAAKHLFIAPDGNLNRLPFETIPTGLTQFLMDQCEVSYITTARDMLPTAQHGSPVVSDPIVIADPNYDLGRHERSTSDAEVAPPVFSMLPGTRLEGETVATMLGVNPYLRDEAVEAVTRNSRSPVILHIASHGFFFPSSGMGASPLRSSSRLDRLLQAEDPFLRSGIAFAGANTWLDGDDLPNAVGDGILNAHDVSTLDLSGTQLVVLSACETGLGDIEIGEGVQGLRQAFMVAGARTVVMSLWPVPDKQTASLMAHFYRQILAGSSKIAALRLAQAAIRKHDSSPFYWGGFILAGDSDALQTLP